MLLITDLLLALEGQTRHGYIHLALDSMGRGARCRNIPNKVATEGALLDVFNEIYICISIHFKFHFCSEQMVD